jgi:hypothetical protein
VGRASPGPSLPDAATAQEQARNDEEERCRRGEAEGPESDVAAIATDKKEKMEKKEEKKNEEEEKKKKEKKEKKGEKKNPPPSDGRSRRQ